MRRARDIRDTTYTYDNVKLQTTNDKISITCKIHGDFTQLPANHLKGNGCPSCATYGFKPDKPAILYYAEINFGEAYKIGITNRSVKDRFRADYAKITAITETHYLLGTDAREREQQILTMYKSSAHTGSPLKSGNTELFTQDILNIFNRTYYDKNRKNNYTE